MGIVWFPWNNVCSDFFVVRNSGHLDQGRDNGFDWIMSNIELLLGFIGFMLMIIWMYVRWIYLKVEYGNEDSNNNC